MHYLYDNTFEGLLTAYYLHHTKSPSTGIYKKESYQVTLMESFEEVETNLPFADKMYTSIKRSLTNETLINLYYCFLSDAQNKDEFIFDYLNFGFKLGREFNNYHTHEKVLPLLKEAKKVKNEVHRYLGYVRFTQLGSVLYSPIHPFYDILPLIAEHFADRYKSESFIIHDKNRNKAIISRNGKWILSDFTKNISSDIREKDYYEDLWKTYFNTIGIESRKNAKLQQNFVPLKYRKDLLEFS